MRVTCLIAAFAQMLVALTLVALTLSACTNRTDQTRDVVVALSAPPASIDPLHATDATGTRIAGLLYSSLVRIGPDLKPTLEAAKTFKQNGTEYVFELYPHLKFADGHELTAKDVEDTVARFQTSPFASSFKLIASIHVTPELKVTIKLTQPSATFLNDLQSLKLMAKDHEGGTGPFTLVSQTANDVVLKSRATPYVTPKIEGVDFKIIRDDNTRVLKMLKGDVDVAQAEFPPLKIVQLEKSEGLTLYKYPGLALTYLLLNLKDPFLAKLQTRQAMAYAVHVADIIKYKMNGLAQPASSLLTPINPFYDASLKPIGPDALRAKQHDSSPELTLKTSSSPVAIDNGRVIANDLKQAGFNVKTQSYEWGTFYGDIQSGRFQLAIMRWVGTIDPDLYRKALHSRETPPGGRNRGCYANSEIDRLTEEGAATIDQDQRKSIYLKVQKAVFADLPFIPLWYDTEVAVVNKRIKDYKPATDGSFWFLTEVEKQ